MTLQKIEILMLIAEEKVKSVYELSKMLKVTIDASVKSGALKPREGVDLLNTYEAVMQEYTYIDHNGHSAAPAAVVPAELAKQAG